MVGSLDTVSQSYQPLQKERERDREMHGNKRANRVDRSWISLGPKLLRLDDGEVQALEVRPHRDVRGEPAVPAVAAKLRKCGHPFVGLGLGVAAEEDLRRLDDDLKAVGPTKIRAVERVYRGGLMGAKVSVVATISHATRKCVQEKRSLSIQPNLGTMRVEDMIKESQNKNGQNRAQTMCVPRDRPGLWA